VGTSVSPCTQAQKKAREVVFNAEDAPNTLGAVHASAMDVARANSARNEAGPGHSFPVQLNLSCLVPETTRVTARISYSYPVSML
jgi:hypothetical protein